MTDCPVKRSRRDADAAASPLTTPVAYDVACDEPRCASCPKLQQSAFDASQDRVRELEALLEERTRLYQGSVDAALRERDVWRKSAEGSTRELDTLTRDYERLNAKASSLRGTICELAEAAALPDEQALKAVRMTFAKLVLAALMVVSACGYSEAEMQAQRDRTALVSEALDRTADDQRACRMRVAELDAQSEQLRLKLDAATKCTTPTEGN